MSNNLKINNTTDISSLLNWMRDYADKRINSSLMDVRRCFSPYIPLDFGNKGLLGLQAPVDCGGLNLSNEDCMAVSTQIGAIDLSLAVFVGLHNHLGLRPIMNFSNDSIRNDLLPELASGRQLSAFGLTEPGAGSNASAIEGQATLQANGKIKINATKMWTGNASWAGVINVFVRYADESGKPQGVCGYVVRQGQPGLEMGEELMTMGMRGMVQNIFTMKDLEVDQSSQLGNLGHGLEVAQDAMMYTRLALGAIFLGGMKRCLQLMVRFADRRTNISTGRLLHNPVTMIDISELTVKARALENLVQFVSRSLDKSIDVPEEFLITTKVSGSEFLWDAADRACQLLGGRGYLENNEVTRIMRDARVGRVFEGPTETMMYYMGSRLSLNAETLIDFLKNNLQAEAIAEQMLEARDIVKARCKKLEAPLSGMRKLNLVNSLLGEIVSWGILLAVAQSEQHDKSLDDARVEAWLEQQFQQSIVAANSTTPGEKAALEPTEILSIIENYGDDIGNMEQTLAGEEWGLDPYLKINQA